MDFRVEHLSQLRRLRNPEDGLRALAERAPEAEALAARVLEKYRPALTWLYVARRRLATATVCLFTVWLFLHVMFGANGITVYRHKRAEYQGLQKGIDGLQKENELYNQRVNALQTDPKMIEKEAREQLHYARPGEVVYVPPPSPPPPANRSAQK